MGAVLIEKPSDEGGMKELLVASGKDVDDVHVKAVFCLKGVEYHLILRHTCILHLS